jgi:hypothetical protein
VPGDSAFDANPLAVFSASAGGVATSGGAGIVFSMTPAELSELAVAEGALGSEDASAGGLSFDLQAESRRHAKATNVGFMARILSDSSGDRQQGVVGFADGESPSSRSGGPRARHGGLPVLGVLQELGWRSIEIESGTGRLFGRERATATASGTRG